MRRALIGVVVALVTVAVSPVVASAAPADHGSKLLNGYQRALVGMTEDDQWLFDDGCIGGATKHDPAYLLVPQTDPATTQSACTVKAGAPVVVSAAGFTCWTPTLKESRDQCETAWADPAQVLLNASVVVDGKTKKLTTYRVSGCITFPEGAVLDVPGTKAVYYGITEAVVLHGLRPGVHTISISFEFADGFAGATTFALTVTR